MLLFYSVLLVYNVVIRCFNTTLVTVLFAKERCESISTFGFNTTLVTVLFLNVPPLLPECGVSIQLLLLFYHLPIILHPLPFLFQYNSCYCSIKAKGINKYYLVVFQYNSCYCSIPGTCKFCWLLVRVSIQLLLLFYKKWARRTRHSDIVSIQLLLLFYWCFCPGHLHPGTVSIQLLLLFYPRKLALFKTIISQKPRKINTFLKFYQAHPIFYYL